MRLKQVVRGQTKATGMQHKKKKEKEKFTNLLKKKNVMKKKSILCSRFDLFDLR